MERTHTESVKFGGSSEDAAQLSETERSFWGHSLRGAASMAAFEIKPSKSI